MSLYEVDRMVVILRPTQAFLDWVNSHAQNENEKVTLNALQEDCTALLIPPFDTLPDAEEYLENSFAEIFENELEGWFIDPSYWPENRTYKLFNEWFNIDFHSLAFDLAYGDEIETEEFTGTLQ